MCSFSLRLRTSGSSAIKAILAKAKITRQSGTCTERTIIHTDGQGSLEANLSCSTKYFELQAHFERIWQHPYTPFSHSRTRRCDLLASMLKRKMMKRHKFGTSLNGRMRWHPRQTNCDMNVVLMKDDIHNISDLSKVTVEDLKFIQHTCNSSTFRMRGRNFIYRTGSSQNCGSIAEGGPMAGGISSRRDRQACFFSAMIPL